MKTILKTIRVFFLICSLFFTLVGPVPVAAAQIVYVKGDVVGGANNGTSWANAYSDLQDTLTAAVSGQELWVAAVYTAYYPSATFDQYKSFDFKSGVAVYGGFGGNETLRSQRNRLDHITRLSGNLFRMGIYTTIQFMWSRPAASTAQHCWMGSPSSMDTPVSRLLLM